MISTLIRRSQFFLRGWRRLSLRLRRFFSRRPRRAAFRPGLSYLVNGTKLQDAHAALTPAWWMENARRRSSLYDNF